MKRVLCLLLAVTMVLCLATGCGKKDDADKTNTGEKVTGGEKGLPEVTITGDKVIICGGPSNVQTYIDMLKEVYELDAELIEVGYNEYTTRFATLVLSGDSPDIGYYRPDSSDFPRYIVNDLVQDAGKYVDLNDSFYDAVRDLLNATKYQGGNYMLPYALQSRQEIVYNEKLFRDAGLETPWELYLKDEWTMDKLEEYATELTEVGPDGIPTRYGFALDRAFGLIYMAGHTLGKYDPTTGKVTDNRKDPVVAKTINRVSKWVNEKKICPPRVDGVLEWFDTDKVAMVFAEGYETAEPLAKLGEAGNLGIAPMARETAADKYYSRGRCESWWLVEGAQNPGGAIAFWNVCIQDYDKGTCSYLEQMIDHCIKETHYSELNVEQLRTCYDTEKVVPVLDLTPWIDGGALWMTFQDSSTWDVQLAKYDASVTASLEALFQPLDEDLPLSPKSILAFNEDKKDGDTVTALAVRADGGQKITATYNKENAQGGDGYALQVKYDVSDKGWGGMSYSFNKTLENNDSLRFWIKGDGSTQIVKLSISTPIGYVGTYEYKLEGKDGKLVTVPFADFTAAEDTGIADLNLKKISDIGIYVQTKGEHTFWLDNLEAINSQK